MNLIGLIQRLKQAEAWREHVYLDTTSHLTIGWGHNLAKLEVVPAGTPGAAKVNGGWVRLTPVNGLPKSIGETLLASDVAAATVPVTGQAWTDRLDDVRREVLVELVFNVGPVVLQYPVFIGQLKRGEYKAAAANLRGWRWATQVGKRADRLCKMLEQGSRLG